MRLPPSTTLFFSSFRLTFPALAVLALAPAAHAAENKVAIVDMQRAVSETNEGARTIDTLKKLSEKREGELNTKRTQIGKDKAELDRKCQARTLPKDQCDRSTDELQRKLMELQNLALEYQTELQKKQGETMQPVVNRMLAVVRRVAQRDGYDMVVDKTVTHFQRSDLDVTDIAIKMFNAESKAPPLTPGAPNNKGAAPATAPKAAPLFPPGQK